MNTYDVKKFRCECGLLLERVSCNRKTKAPTAGTLSLCTNCGALYRFDSELNFVHLSEEEFYSLPEKLRERIITVSNRIVKYVSMYGSMYN
jgi:predicted metal-binding transcription factor (methanogenesis marker protein 9)